MLELIFSDEVEFCRNCGDPIVPGDAIFHDAEMEEDYCFYCYKHLFSDPYQDIPYDEEQLGY